jgi:hypothetical protein
MVVYTPLLYSPSAMPVLDSVYLLIAAAQVSVRLYQS